MIFSPLPNSSFLVHHFLLSIYLNIPTFPPLIPFFFLVLENRTALIMRAALIASSSVLRARTVPLAARAGPLAFARHAHAHTQESFEAFTERYVSFFQSVQDLFELQRGLNNCFAHDLVPAPTVVEAALRAARRVNDYSTAVRIFEGVREKVENKQQYGAYLEELKSIREELGKSFGSPCRNGALFFLSLSTLLCCETISQPPAFAYIFQASTQKRNFSCHKMVP